MAEVFVIDRVVTAPGCAQKFVDAYLAGYAPGARDRGMTLRNVLVSPPIWFDDRSNVVTITWTLPSPEAWWQMTWRGRPDPSVARWWDSITDLVVERTREVASASGDVDVTALASAATSTGAATFGVTRLIDVDESERSRILGALRDAAERSGALRSVVEPTLPGSRNGGDILVHLRFACDSDWENSRFDAALTDPAITRVNGVTYHGSPMRRGSGTVYRALLLRVSAEVEAETVAAFERELTLMPRYVPTIAAWQLSRVEQAIGTSEWTHVFEQEFTDVDGLMGPYLMHPIHWAVVDRWFDPETTDMIVRDRVCHSFCELNHPVLPAGI
ncbi:Dabb family protein [Mycobacterium sp. TNTM28]|uniref:Dabb family protein n=1 Tax=[Mycobacterium] fortunisiensis TaxID=2600579 RepID=A0ABS6KGZ2_9MYCO|nr:Dabb family protein [[Mycobacterium] fortunisiensis]MBU9762827.1 Dabb family protein [[Mycobacterium] fortunisiensis]